MARSYLSYSDMTGEIAFAVLMVIIINGYVALSNLNTGFLYIVAVNLGACAGWGFIDGIIYAISSSIERNHARKKLKLLKSLPKGEHALSKVEESLDDTFLSSFDEEGKKAIAQQIITHVQQASFKDTKIITREEAIGWLSIIAIYLTVGVLMALPFLVLADKILAWFISNVAGTAWLFWYGVQLGKSVEKYRLLLGVTLALVGVFFLVGSYLIWTQSVAL